MLGVRTLEIDEFIHYSISLFNSLKLMEMVSREEPAQLEATTVMLYWVL